MLGDASYHSCQVGLARDCYTSGYTFCRYVNQTFKITRVLTVISRGYRMDDLFTAITQDQEWMTAGLSHAHEQCKEACVLHGHAYSHYKLCYVTLCYVMLCYVMLCYLMLCYIMLCYFTLCYVMLCHVMLYLDRSYVLRHNIL